MLINSLLFSSLIIFFGAPIGLTYFIGHLGTIIVSFFTLKDLSKHIFFWIILTLIFFTASEPRLSIEYFIFASAYFFLGIKGGILSHDTNIEKRKKTLFILFLILVFTSKLNYSFSEKGSLLLWLPVYLALYYEKINLKNSLIYLASGFILFFSNKLSTLIAFMFSLRSKFFYFTSFVLAVCYLVYKQGVLSFLVKSFKPRIYILKSSLNGFFDSPIWGHGFGTFALDFPEYRVHGNILGGKISQQIVHGHNLFSHYGFELGSVGIILILILFYLVYKNVKRAFLPLLIVSVCDATLVSFSQFLLFGLVLSPFVKDLGIFNFLNFKLNKGFLSKLFSMLLLCIYLTIFIPSIFGHCFYEKRDYDNAIKWDKYHPLYWFTRGAENLNKNTIQSESDFKKAIELSSSIPYFYGFLGAAELANGKKEEAKKTLEKAMKLDGKDGYWCLLYAYANYENKKIFEEYKRKAIKKNPEITKLLLNPSLTSTKFIGKSKYGDVRIGGFYRTGKKIFFPLPIIYE